jgi:hypothetical protein
MKKIAYLLITCMILYSVTAGLIPIHAFAADDFILVTDITDVPTQTMAGTPLTLTGAVVPDNATCC